MFNRLTVFSVCLMLLSGCAGTFDITYANPATTSVTLTASVPDKTETPIFLDVCTGGKWQRAAVVGNGLYKIGSIIASERHTGLTQSPSAVKLSDTAVISVPANQTVKFRIMSHWEATGWSGVGQAQISSCSIAASIKTELNYDYRAVWLRGPSSCVLKVTKISLDGKAETLIPNNVDTKASCET